MLSGWFIRGIIMSEVFSLSLRIFFDTDTCSTSMLKVEA